MIGALIGGALSLGSSIYGGFQAAKAAKKAKAITEREGVENETWFQKKFNENYLNRSDTQRALNFAKKSAKDYIQGVSGTAAVTGASDEATALAKKAAVDMIGNTTADIASQASSYKDAVENQYRARKAEIEGEKKAIEYNRAQNIANAASGAAQVGSDIIGADAGGIFGKYKKAKGGV